jgi:hypothetical protein
MVCIGITVIYPHCNALACGPHYSEADPPPLRKKLTKTVRYEPVFRLANRALLYIRISQTIPTNG